MHRISLALLLIVLAGGIQIVGSMSHCELVLEGITFGGTPEYDEVMSEKDADIVLAVDIWNLQNPNGESAPETHRFSLHRNAHPDYEGINWSSHQWVGCGGSGGGSGGYTLAHGGGLRSKVVVVVISSYWDKPNGDHGERKINVTVPWLGESRQTLDQDTHVHAYFRDPSFSGRN